MLCKYDIVFYIECALLDATSTTSVEIAPVVKG